MKKRQAKKKSSTEDTLTIGEHLRELKHRLFLVAIAYVVMFAAVFYMYGSKAIKYFIEMGEAVGYRFFTQAPSEVFMAEIKVAGSMSLLLILPLIFYQLYAYVSPGTKKLKILFCDFIISLMFLLGDVFAVKVILPFMLSFFMSTLTDSNMSSVYASMGIESYTSFCVLVLEIFGAILEMPVICFILAKAGLINGKMLAKAWKVITIIIFVIAAIITPPDPTSMFMVAIPMMALYGICIILTNVVNKKEQED